jgi:NADPH:quinone reductase
LSCVATAARRRWSWSLTGLSGLAAAGKLALRVADTYPLAEAAKAHERLQAGGVRGRLVIAP